MAIYCLLSSFILFISYIIYIRIKYNPNCISQSYYLLDNKNIFPIWITGVALLIFPAWVELSPENFQFLAFLSVVFLIAVGLFPKYLEEDKKIHILSALITFAISFIWSIVINILYIPIIFIIILILLFIFNSPNKIFQLECLAFLNIYLSILIKLSLVL